MKDKSNMKEKKNRKNDQPTLTERYKMLIAARNFHYENFNKWITYFYVAIGALFLSYCTIISAITKNNMLEYLLLIMGYIVSILWYWSCKGYYFWNINYIMLVNYYEEELLKLAKEARVYFVFANTKTENNYFSPIRGANISTSKVAILFAYITTSVWGFLLLYNVFKDLEFFNDCMVCIIFISIILSAFMTLLISYLFPRKVLASKIDHFPDLKLKQEKKNNAQLPIE